MAREMIKPYYNQEGIVLYCGDCREIVPSLDMNKIDLVLMDPPYGIDWQGSNFSTRKWDGFDGDGGELDLRFLLNMKCEVFSFGANNYPEQLPHKGRWVCWDKRVKPTADKMKGSSFELAWTNRTSGFNKMYRLMSGGVLNSDMGTDGGKGEKRVHPSQKPIGLMRMILQQDYPNATMILDPFAGSGTVGIACKQLGRKCIMIEIEEKYCEIIVKRLKRPQFDVWKESK